jgi:type II secretory pathway pseudopilin PulG
MHSRNALTLMELVVVLAVLAAVSGLLAPLFSGTMQNANEVVTKRSLQEIGDALSDFWRDTKHVPLDGITTFANEADRLSVDWLFANPVTGESTWGFSPSTTIGWRGPYIAGSTGNVAAASSPSLIDAWNQEIKIHDVDSTASLRDVRVVSGGPNRVIDIPPTKPTGALTTTDIGDDIYVTLTLR